MFTHFHVLILITILNSYSSSEQEQKMSASNKVIIMLNIYVNHDMDFSLQNTFYFKTAFKKIEKKNKKNVKIYTLNN